MSSAPKRHIFEAFADTAKAVAHPNRLEMLELLAQGESSVETLATRTGLAVANTSQHLQQLRQAGLVTVRRDGKFKLYRIADDTILELTAALRRVTERRRSEVDKIVRSYFAERDALEPVSRIELLKRLHDETVTLLDVRPADEFAQGHIPGALNFSLHELVARLAELPPDRSVVAYCRGAYCVLAYEAVAALRAQGFTAHRLEDGFPEWRAAGLAVEL